MRLGDYIMSLLPMLAKRAVAGLRLVVVPRVERAGQLPRERERSIPEPAHCVCLRGHILEQVEFETHTYYY